MTQPDAANAAIPENDAVTKMSAEATAHVERHQSFHVRIYLAAAFMGAISNTFGDPVVLTNLGAKIDAPGWLRVLPAVAPLTLSYLTVILMGWFFKPEHSRAKTFFYTVGPTYAMYLILGTALWLNLPSNQLIYAMIAAVLAFAIMDGFSMLPSADLLARLCSKNKRASLVSMNSGVSYTTMIVAASGAAWLIRGDSFLKYPYNYAACVTIYSVMGIAGASVFLWSREYKPDVVTVREPFGEYLRDLIGIFKHDHAFRTILKVACLGAMLQTVAPVIQVYAQMHRGMTDADVSHLLAIKPWAFVAMSLLGVWLAHKLGNVRMAMIPVFLVAVSAILAPFTPGKWQVVSQLLAWMCSHIYPFLLLVVMHHAPPLRNTRYLTVYYTLAIVPGLFPLLLGYFVEAHPSATLGAIVAVALMTVALLIRLHQQIPNE